MQDINTLLDQALEIEGLLRVLLVRDDSQVRALLQHKAQSLSAALADGLCVADNEGCAEADGRCPIPEEQEAAPADGQCVLGEQIDIDSDFSVDIVEFEPEEPVEKEEVRAAAPSVAEQEARTAESVQAPKSFITFNEKYRFARELFNNQHALMGDVVAKVTSMHSLPEAYDYVINDLKLDEDNPVVIEFLEVIARYFNSRT